MKATNIEAKEMVTTKIEGETLLIKGEVMVGENGESMLLNSDGVTISKELHVQDISARHVFVNGTISGPELNLSKGLSIQNNSIALTNGTIESSNGFVSKEGSLVCKDIRTSGNIQVDGTIESTGSIISNESITSRTLSISQSIDTSSIIVSNTAELNCTQMNEMHVSNKCSIDGLLEANGNVTLNGDMVTITSPIVKLKDMEVENGITSKSIFSSRLYTEDVAASGFITAGTITCKEMLMTKSNVEMEGKVTIKNDLTVDNVHVSNALSSTTIQASSLTVGGIEARKIRVDGHDMTIGGINVMEQLDTIQDLEKRITELEALVSKLLTM